MNTDLVPSCGKTQIKHNTVTLREYQTIKRIRQLYNSGAKLVILELCEQGPKVMKVGKPEG